VGVTLASLAAAPLPQQGAPEQMKVEA
jgi:hypothetical protein